MSPFDVMPAQAMVDKQVRIVIDDSAVREDEIGRKSLVRNIVLIVIGVVLGLGMGYAVMSTASERTQFNMAVRDGKAIYSKISEVSKQLDVARASVKSAVEATQGGAGRQAHVDYKAIGDLVALQKPFSAQEFSRRRYLAFPSAVVDDLFEYYNNINLLWSKFGVLGNRIMGPNARDALDKSAQAGDQLVTQDYGVVVTKSDGSFIGGLVVVRPKPTDAGDGQGEKEKGKGKGKGKDKEKDETPIALVSSRAGSREVERKMFLGQEDFPTSPDHYVVVVDKARSMGLLGVGASLFGQLRGDLVETQQLLDKTSELQGRLLKELGKVAALQEQKLL